MANVVYNAFKKYLMNGSVDLDTDTVKVLLVTSSYNAADASKQDNHAFVSAAAWVASTVYAVGARVRPTTRNGHIYECTTGGTSAATEPTWPTTDGATVTDGTVTWTCREDGDVQFYEVTGTGYTAGGQALANKTVTQDNTDNEGVFDADDVVWTGSTITARGAIVYKSRGGAAAADELVCFFDFTTDHSSTNSTFTVQWNVEGILNLN